MSQRMSPGEIELFDVCGELATALCGEKCDWATHLEMRRVHKQWKVERMIDTTVEARRVQAIIAREAVEREQDMDRKEAEALVRGGGWAHPDKLVVPPTPELLASGEFESVRAIRDEGVTHYIEGRTIRRQTMMRITKLHTAGIIDDDRFAACKVYRDAYEASGLTGSYAVTKLTGTGGGERAFGDMPKTEREVAARYLFRRCREYLDPALVKGFDYVVLEDQSIEDAARLARLGHRAVKHAIVVGSDWLFQFMLGAKILGHEDEDTQHVA